MTTESGREELVGSELDCLLCNMPTLPDGLSVYKSTKTFWMSSSLSLEAFLITGHPPICTLSEPRR